MKRNIYRPSTGGGENERADIQGNDENSQEICLQCKHARFPEPWEQCYMFGGLICTRRNDENVGKYDSVCEEFEPVPPD